MDRPGKTLPLRLPCCCVVLCTLLAYYQLPQPQVLQLVAAAAAAAAACMVLAGVACFLHVTGHQRRLFTVARYRERGGGVAAVAFADDGHAAAAAGVAIGARVAIVCCNKGQRQCATAAAAAVAAGTGAGVTAIMAAGWQLAFVRVHVEHATRTRVSMAEQLGCLCPIQHALDPLLTML